MTIDRPNPCFLGYTLKSAVRPPKWTAGSGVEEICSVCDCIADRPTGWQERWDFNRASYYATPSAALAAHPTADVGVLHLFAYEFFPLRFEPKGTVTVIDPANVFGGPLEPAPDTSALSALTFLGYDAVERWSEEEPGVATPNCLGGGFGCSPLSCNSQAPFHPVNRFCLLDRWGDGVAAAAAFARDQPEPGCYYLFGVWRGGTA